jgi:hypothetical protein
LRHIVTTGIGTCLLFGAVATAGAALDPAAYVGSDRCKACHADKYAGWEQTFHATVVQDAKANPSAVKGDFKAPGLGFTLKEVEYTIGGHRDQRYMKRIGDDYYVLPKLWSVQARVWRPYNVFGWKKMPYGKFCKGCHVTGYAPEKNVTAEHRVGCEACHGPGKEHAASPGKGSIVNPRKLTDDRREMICAACHVRGTDPTEVYSFPVGYTPGEDLGTYYVPAGKADEETNSQAILRGFAKWKKQREAGLQSQCEVCGIPGAPEKKTGPEGPNDFCFGCHDIKAKYAEHSRHAASVTLACHDCHVQQTKEAMNSEPTDIHSYGYFLVHEEQCYDPDLAKSCAKCHSGKGLSWARQTVETWKKPVEIDH